MTVFWFYLCVILVVVTVAAALADWLGRAFPDFLEPDDQSSSEAASERRRCGGSRNV